MGRSIEDILAQARRPERLVPLCLRGDLVAQWQQLNTKLAGASTMPASLGDRSEASVLAEQIRDLEAQMRAAEVPFNLRALEPMEWSEFWGTRPIRQKDEAEKDFDERWFAWACQMVALTCVDPIMSAEQVDRLVPALSSQQWDALADNALDLNIGKVTVPFSEAASRLTPATAPTSGRPEQPASASADSSASSPDASPPTSTTTPAG